MTRTTFATLALSLPLSLVACSTPPADGTPGPTTVEGTTQCDLEAVQQLVTQPASQQLATDALTRTGAKTVRWIRPGDAVTMDFRTDRLNIELDAQDRVARFRCG